MLSNWQPIRARCHRMPPARRGGAGWLRAGAAGLLLVALVCVSAQRAAGVVVHLKNQDAPIRGYLVSAGENVVVVAEILPDGATSERAIPRSEIQTVIRAVSDEGLAALHPDDPDGYCAYADALAAERDDPDAQRTAIRLYQIAAHLDPPRLGHRCVLSMLPLARHAAEERLWRAMAYLLDPDHDRAVLQVSAAQPERSTELDPRQVELWVKPLRALRQGQQRDALALARRYKLKERLPLLTDAIRYEEFEQACQPTCPHCTRGQQPCPECRGTRFVSGTDGSRVACPACGAKGNVVCSACGGNYRFHPVPAALLERIVQLEARWLPGAETFETSPHALHPSWSRAVQQGADRVPRGLALETLTEFDPRQCRFQDGRWTF